MDRPIPAAALSDLPDFGIRLTPAPEVWKWLQAEILADTGTIHNEDHAHLLGADMRTITPTGSTPRLKRPLVHGA